MAVSGIMCKSIVGSKEYGGEEEREDSKARGIRRSGGGEKHFKINLLWLDHPVLFTNQVVRAEQVIVPHLYGQPK